MKHLSTVAKALVGAAAAGAGALATAAADDTVTSGEWYAVVAATLVALAAVWRVPNADEEDLVDGPSPTERDEGALPA